MSYSEAHDKAEMLNDQFFSEYTTEDMTSFPDLGPGIAASVPPLRISEKDTGEDLEGLNPHKATGADQISSRFLKEMASSIAPALTLIYQASHDQEQTPDDWKGTFITPLFKKGDKSKPSNYILVSLTSVSSQVMEHILHCHITKFLDEEKILSDQQHSFMKRRSCETQLINTIQHLAFGLNNHQHR